MKIVNFQGGLGNQMLIYMFYLYLKDKYPHEQVYGAYWSGSLKEHSDFIIDKIFQLKLPPHTLFSDTVSKIAYLLEKYHIVSREETEHSIFYDGYWLDKKYWENFEPKNIFQFQDYNLSEANKKYKDIIVNSNAVSVHLRRGDYLIGNNKKYFGNYCTLEYYKSAINIIKEKIENPKFIIFSDNIEWVKNNLPLSDAAYISGNNGNDSWIDMYLMSLCHHNIIANSTFSYWAAMLNKHQDKIVFYPHKWFIWENPDIFPSSWISL